MLIPMDLWQILGRFSRGTPSQSQCPSWFWQSHISGCDSNDDISLTFIGSELGKWPIEDDGILWDGLSPNIHYLYTWRRSYIYGKAALTVALTGTRTACYDSNPVLILCWSCASSGFLVTFFVLTLDYRYLAGSDIIFWQSEFLYSLRFGFFSLDFWLPIFYSNTRKFLVCWPYVRAQASPFRI